MSNTNPVAPPSSSPTTVKPRSSSKVKTNQSTQSQTAPITTTPKTTTNPHILDNSQPEPPKIVYTKHEIDNSKSKTSSRPVTQQNDIKRSPPNSTLVKREPDTINEPNIANKSKSYPNFDMFPSPEKFTSKKILTNSPDIEKSKSEIDDTIPYLSLIRSELNGSPNGSNTNSNGSGCNITTTSNGSSQNQQNLKNQPPRLHRPKANDPATNLLQTFPSENISLRQIGTNQLPVQNNQITPSRIIQNGEKLFSKTVATPNSKRNGNNRIPYEIDLNGIWDPQPRKLDHWLVEESNIVTDPLEPLLYSNGEPPSTNSSNFSLFSNPFFSSSRYDQTAFNNDMSKSKSISSMPYLQPIGSQLGSDTVRPATTSGSYDLFDSHSLFQSFTSSPLSTSTVQPNSSPLH